MRFAALVLAGGRSRRMGRPKEALPLRGTTLLGWQCDILSTCADPVVVVAREHEQSLPPLRRDIELAFDPTPDQGPLAAIATGLHFLHRHHAFTDRDAAIAVGCDQPFLRKQLVTWLRELLEDANLVIPQAKERLQPLTAVYRVGVRHTADRLLADGIRRPRELAHATASRIVTEDELRTQDPNLDCLRNLNHDSDYQRAILDLESRPDD